MSEELCRDKPSILCLVEAHLWIRVSFVAMDHGLPQNTIWKVCPDTIIRSSVAKLQRNLKMTVFQENGHRIKITQPNLMILVSFSSAEDALSNDVKKT